MHVCGQNERLGLLWIVFDLKKKKNIRELVTCITVVCSSWWSDRLFYLTPLLISDLSVRLMMISFVLLFLSQSQLLIRGLSSEGG